MPWLCLTCKTPIQHAFSGEPRPGVVYRCGVCRLELIVDKKTNALTVAPLKAADKPKRPPRSRRRATSRD